jgi:hypothetical protein
VVIGTRHYLVENASAKKPVENINQDFAMVETQ